MMEAMQRALEVPHMTFCDEVHADRLGQLRSDLREAAERRGVRLSYLHLIVKVGTCGEWAEVPAPRRALVPRLLQVRSGLTPKYPSPGWLCGCV